MVEISCILCGNNRSVVEKFPQTFSENQLTPAVFSARRITEHWHYRIVKCTTCSMVFSSPILPENKLLELYTESAVTYEKEIEYITESYAQHLKPFLSKIQKFDTAIEIGCGNGFFLEWLKGIGFKSVIGFEPSKGAVEKAKDWLKPHINQCFFEQDKSLLPESVDLICSFQTLDHIVEPFQMLEKCRNMLCKGGLAYFITHNEHALQASILGSKSPIYDIEHIYLFNKITLWKIFEKAGFEVVSIGSVKNTYSLDYWINMTPLIGKRFLKYIVNLLKINKINISIKAGNIWIVAIKK
jgi:hypothetical protein